MAFFLGMAAPTDLRHAASFCCRALALSGIDVPLVVDLELDKYLNERGKKKLMFQKDMVIEDPSGTQQKFL